MRFEISNWPVLAAILLLATSSLSAATNNLTSLLQQGLFEEEANRNLVAAVANYQALAAQFDKDRQLAATAVFRLGECYRKLGQTNEATASYQRILREFSDETTLVALCRQNLAGMGVTAPVSETTAAVSGGEYVVKSGESLSRILTAINSQILEGSTRITMNDLLSVNPGLSPQRLRVGQKIAFPAITAPAPATVVIDDEETEIRRLQAMIQNSPDLKNAPSVSGDSLTPLCRAAFKGQLRVAEFLLVSGADVDQIGNTRTPLQYAAAAGHKRMVELLLSHGANVNAKDATEKTPLHLALEKNFSALAETLLTAKADVNAGDLSATTPLMLAVKNGNRPLATAMLARGADPNLLNKYLAGAGDSYSDLTRWGTALHFAAARRDAAMTALLLTNRANVKLRGAVGGCSPLDLAAYVGATEVAALLIAAGADVNAAGPKGTGGVTPLYRATDKGQRDMVKLLLEHGANPNATATLVEQYVTPLMVAADAEIATLLLEHKADPNLKDGKGNTALIRAINANKPDVVRTLLAHGADANLRTATGNPPLIIAAAEQPSKEIVTALLEAKADVNAADQNGKTTLHYVAAMGNRELVALLLGAHADVNARARGGYTPLHVAVAVGAKNQEIVDLLLAAKADPNVRNGDGLTPLDLAKGNSRSPGMTMLRPGMPPLSRGEQTRTPGMPPPVISSVSVVLPGSAKTGEKPETSLVDLLRQHGAIDDLPNTDRIEVRRPSANFSEVVFRKGTNDWNGFTLLELLGRCYGFVSFPKSSPNAPNEGWSGRDELSFPDFGKVRIHRAIDGGGVRQTIETDVRLLLESGDCSRDVGLEWGDWVEIPEVDHPVDQKWTGLSTNEITTLFRCVSRIVTLVVKGSTNSLAVLTPGLAGLEMTWPPGINPSSKTIQQFQGCFMLNAVLHGSGLLRASSDLTRVKVTRPDPATGNTREWTLDSSGYTTSSDLWLRNGDVIEVPEK